MISSLSFAWSGATRGESSLGLIPGPREAAAAGLAPGWRNLGERPFGTGMIGAARGFDQRCSQFVIRRPDGVTAEWFTGGWWPAGVMITVASNCHRPVGLLFGEPGGCRR